MTLDARILEFLRQEGASLPANELSARLGVTVATLQDRVAHLRKLGYEIQSTPHQGYQLGAEPDILAADDLRSLLSPDCILGREIQVFGETGSTNDLAEKLGRDGAREGIVVFADTQTRGRGRLGRNWFSPAGKGLWFSILLRPEARPQAATQLTVAAAISLVRAFRNHAKITPQIKWPNDILAGGKKLAGILTEMNAEIDRIRYIVLGIGVDVNLSRDELPADLRQTATSLLIETGRRWRRAEIAARILRELDADYARIQKGLFAEVAEEWEDQCSTLGQQVSIQMGARSVHGRAESLDDDGALLVRTEHGHLERVVGGDVRLE